MLARMPLNSFDGFIRSLSACSHTTSCWVRLLDMWPAWVKWQRVFIPRLSVSVPNVALALKIRVLFASKLFVRLLPTAEYLGNFCFWLSWGFQPFNQRISIIEISDFRLMARPIRLVAYANRVNSNFIFWTMWTQSSVNFTAIIAEDDCSDGFSLVRCVAT